MEISKWYLKGKITVVNKEELHFNGTRYSIHSEETPLNIKFKKYYPIYFTRYTKRLEGIIIKLNKTTAIVRAFNSEEYKIGLDNIIEANSHVEKYYRFQAKDGKGFFQSSTKGLPQELIDLKNENAQRLKERYYSFPTPCQDEYLHRTWLGCNQEAKENIFFACFSKETLEEWVSPEVMEAFSKYGFEIVEVQKGYDYFSSISGTNQTMLFKKPLVEFGDGYENSYEVLEPYEGMGINRNWVNGALFAF